MVGGLSPSFNQGGRHRCDPNGPRCWSYGQVQAVLDNFFDSLHIHMSKHAWFKINRAKGPPAAIAASAPEIVSISTEVLCRYCL
jgi:hypothetical protein